MVLRAEKSKHGVPACGKGSLQHSRRHPGVWERQGTDSELSSFPCKATNPITVLEGAPSWPHLTPIFSQRSHFNFHQFMNLGIKFWSIQSYFGKYHISDTLWKPCPICSLPVCRINRGCNSPCVLSTKLSPYPIPTSVIVLRWWSL